MVINWLVKWTVLFVVWVLIIAGLAAIHPGLGALVFICIVLSAIEEMFAAFGIGPRAG